MNSSFKDIDFMINLVNEKLTNIDSYNMALATMVSTYFGHHLPDKKKKAEIVQAINNCQKAAERPLNHQFDVYFRKQLLGLIDDKESKNKLIAILKNSSRW